MARRHAARVLLLMVVTGTVAALASPALPSSAAPGKAELRYTIREARGYAYRVTLRKEVIEGARQAEPCDPAEDPYQCDTTRYEHQPNCAEQLTTGPAGDAPEVRQVPGAKPLEGGAGKHEGAGSEPPTASPVALNELLSLAHLGRVGDLVEAGGLASDSYVDLSGRQEPTMHTESDVIPGTPSYEERCLDEDPSHRSYRHFLSRTNGKAPETYHLAECRKDDCSFDRALFSAQDVMARTIVHLREQRGKVIGQIQATFQDAVWGNGALAIDSVDTVLSFESDGTAEGLKWSVGTTAKGVTLGGNPVTLPTGRLLGTPDLQAGVAAPYVSAAEDGSSLKIVAPGVVVASREQTAWFGGAQVEATFPRPAPGGGAAAGGNADAGGSEGSATEGGTAGGTAAGASGASTDGAVGSAGGAGAAGSGTGEGNPATTPVSGAAAGVLVNRFETDLPFYLIIGLGLLGALLIIDRWMRQFPAGVALSYYPPFSLIDRLYRTFAKS
ncbi:MAG: hypothetical protein ACRDH9_09430 [Actinomycetota bacterium]